MSYARVIRPGSPRGAALALLTCIVWAGPAHAEPGESQQAADTSEPIGVLEVATYGVSQAAGDKFEQSVEETLRGVGFRVVRSQQVQQELAGTNYVIGCTVGPCIKEVGARTGLRRVLVARIQGAGQTYSVVVSLVDTGSGQLVSQVAQSCPVCTVEDAISTSIKAVVALLTDEKAAQAGGAANLNPATPAAVAEKAAEAPADTAPLERRRQQARRFGWIFVVAGTVAIGAAVGLAATDNENAALAAGGAGGGLAVGGLTALLWSQRF
jgi:hypothetical protein